MEEQSRTANNSSDPTARSLLPSQPPFPPSDRMLNHFAPLVSLNTCFLFFFLSIRAFVSGLCFVMQSFNAFLFFLSRWQMDREWTAERRPITRGPSKGEELASRSFISCFFPFRSSFVSLGKLSVGHEPYLHALVLTRTILFSFSCTVT